MPLNISQKRQEYLREYQRKWMAKRRQEWFNLNGPCVQCGSTEKLELDHIDPTTKVTHALWSWTKARRDIELAKCQVLCHDCHLRKTKLQVGIDCPPGTSWCGIHKEFLYLKEFPKDKTQTRGVKHLCKEHYYAQVKARKSRHLIFS